ncbi:2-hydroxyacid dehydrogenase [Bacillus massiliigorillae]|uniref:2-hydroxyacid dehydrogenase n=1 Tax=Bacillus massiliigorillae TaxID=1243664 RepID=UPI0003A63ACE|nr:D-glycerate dehydrogenase [Bacillus massiliigorillae]
MKPKVIVYKRVPQQVLEYIQEYCDVVYYERLTDDNRASFLIELQDANGLMGNELAVNEMLLDQAPHLKVVSNIAVGYDNLDIAQLSKRGILATNTPEILNDTTADTIFGLLLATARRFPELDQYVKTGQWKGSVEQERFGVDVHHKVIGIIGMGGIGATIAKRAHLGFDMKVLYHNRTHNEAAERLYDATYCGLEELLQQSDFVVLMTPLTPQTAKLMGEKEFKLMKKSAFFINGSRGKTVDEEALVKALQEEEIAGAGLDVFVQEPIQNHHPLLSMKNVVTLPHVGSATHETRLNMSMLAAENLVAALQGKCPSSLINREVYTKA